MSAPGPDALKQIAALREEFHQLLREVREAHSKEIHDLEVRHSKQILELKAEITTVKESYDAELDEVRKELQEVQDCFDPDDGADHQLSETSETHGNAGEDPREDKPTAPSMQARPDITPAAAHAQGIDSKEGKAARDAPTPASQSGRECSRCGSHTVTVYGPYNNNRYTFKCSSCGSQAKPTDAPIATAANSRIDHGDTSTPLPSSDNLLLAAPRSSLLEGAASPPQQTFRCKRCGSARVCAYGPFRYWYAPHSKWRYRCSNCGCQAAPHLMVSEPHSAPQSPPDERASPKNH